MKMFLTLVLSLFAITAGAQAPVMPAASPTPVVATAAPVEQPALPPNAWQIPDDSVGFVGGEVHGIHKILLSLIALMTLLRGLSEILSKLALVTGNAQVGVAAQATATTLRYLAWAIGIFSAGPVKSIPHPSELSGAPGEKKP